MAVEDGRITEGSSLSSVICDSQESDRKRDVLSPEDIAWVDSCLIKEPEISDGNWDSVKDALLEVLSSQPGLYNPSAYVSEINPSDNDIEMLASREGTETDWSLGMGEETKEIIRTPNDIFPINEEAESSGDNFPTKDSDDLRSLAFVGNPFLPSYTNGLKETPTTESGTDSSSSADEMEPSTNDIFRIWDLNIPTEENELGKQLNKIFEESDQSAPDASDDSSAGKDLKEESLDDVIAAISDLSLK